MIEVTVKTLDSLSRPFSVPADITVQGFKEHIAGTVNVPVDRQRLIYQGRVLQDDVPLNANGDINGKVVHLVERFPTPAEPTPAELARGGSRLPQPGAQAQQNAGPRAQAPQLNPANIMGPFPMPGPAGNFNSQQFVQQMLQQAIGGMSNPMGPTIVRGSVRHPNAPGGDSRTEIQIHITPQGAGAQQVRMTAGQPGQPRHQTPVGQRGPSPQQGIPGQPVPQPPNVSEPRRQLNYVEYLITKLEEHVTSLETGNLEQAQTQGDGPSTSGESSAATASGNTSEAAPSEPMDVQSSATSQQTPAAGAASQTTGPSLSRHPSLPHVGRVLRRVTALETRFLPFLTEYTDFLEKDPAFASTENPEYKRMMAFLTVVLKAQRALSHIHRTLSLIVIPLSETPPRSMLIQGDCPRHRAGPPTTRRIQNVATAGSYLNRQQQGPGVPHRHVAPHMIRGPYQVGMPVFFGQFGAGGPRNMRPGMMPMPPAMFGFRPGTQHQVRPHQSGLYGHPPPPPPQAQTPMGAIPTMVQSSFPQQPTVVRTLPGPPASTPATEPSGPATVSTAPPQANATSTTSTPSSSTPSSASTHVEFMPAEYAVQVTTHIQPNININITPGSLASAAASVVGGSVHGTEEFVENVAGEGGDEPMDDGHHPEQVFSFSGSVETDEHGNVMPPQLSLPNIPGISPDNMRQIIHGVQESVQQVMNVMQTQPQVPGSVTGQTTSQRDLGRFSFEGLPLGPNQIPIEVANIIGQTVQNIVLNHLNVETPEQPESSSAPTSTVNTEGTTQPPPSPITTSTQPTSSTTSSASTTASVPTPVPTPTPVTTAPVPVATSAATPVTRATTPVAAPTTSARSPSSQASSQPPTRNMLAGLLAQINDGAYDSQAASGTDSPSTAPSSEATPAPKVEGHSGKRRRKLPAIRRTPNCVNDVVRGQGYPREMMELTGQENIISLVLFLSGELLTIADCISFMGGASEPANRLRGPLRRALIECWFDGQVPTRDQIEAEVDWHSEEARPSISGYFRNHEPKSPDIDLVESNLSLYRHVLRRILHLLFINSAENFARDILCHMMDCFSLTLHLNMNILKGTEEAVVQIVMRQLGSALDPFTMGGASGGNPDPMVEQIRGTLASQLIPFARNRPVSQDQIDQFVMNIPTPQEPEPESVPEPVKEPEKTTPSPSFVDEKEEDQENVEVKQASGEDSTDPPEEPKDDEMVEEEATESDQPQNEGAVGGDADWRSMVPEDWVSVINSDIEKQKNLPEQPPYSDAYMAGMPASKRRKV